MDVLMESACCGGNERDMTRGSRSTGMRVGAAVAAPSIDAPTC